MEVTFEEILKEKGVLLYTITGISMLPLMRAHRDLIIVVPSQERLGKYDIPVFKRDNGEYVVHRILKVYDDGYGIVGDNQSELEYVREDQIIGVVDRMERNGKTIPLRKTSEHPRLQWKYTLYVHLWCDVFPVRAFLVRVEHKLRQWRKNISR